MNQILSFVAGQEEHCNTLLIEALAVSDKQGECSSCIENTKYMSLRCLQHICVRCSIFENDKTVLGWKAGSSVAYCKPCFCENMDEMNVNQGQDKEADETSHYPKYYVPSK